VLCEEFHSGVQEAKTVLDPKLLNGFHLEEDRAVPVGGYVFTSNYAEGWVGSWLLIVFTLTAVTTDKVRSKDLVRLAELLTSVAPHGVGNIRVNRKWFISNREGCRQLERVKDGMQTERFVFTINLATRDTKCSGRADCNSSPDIPASESV
jgi:hypothetical protein